METIKNYLDQMFANMPNTEAVRRAKSELLQMMEDKYNELIEEGKSENEAVGAVISDFGNLEELAEDLGVASEVQEEKRMNEENPRRRVSLEEAKDYIRHQGKAGIIVGLGVLLCITSVIWPISTDSLKLNDGFGVIGMFISIGIAVALFVTNGVISEAKWKFIEKERCAIDLATSEYVKKEEKSYITVHAIQKAIGVVCCALCWLPAALADEFGYHMFEDFAGAILFILVGVGVFLIVSTNYVNGAYETLLGLNTKFTNGSVPKQEEKYCSPVAEVIMEVFWPTITCIYLGVSFITCYWHITWIIWPVASIIFAVLKATLRARD